MLRCISVVLRRPGDTSTTLPSSKAAWYACQQAGEVQSSQATSGNVRPHRLCVSGPARRSVSLAATRLEFAALTATCAVSGFGSLTVGHLPRGQCLQKRSLSQDVLPDRLHVCSYYTNQSSCSTIRPSIDLFEASRGRVISVAVSRSISRHQGPKASLVDPREYISAEGCMCFRYAALTWADCPSSLLLQ